MFFSKTRNYEYRIFRPILPPGWEIMEELSNVHSKHTSVYKMGKLHPQGEPQRIFVIFGEYNPHGNIISNFTVRGGRYAKPDEDLRKFENYKDAESYFLHILDSTDRWLTEIEISGEFQKSKKK